MLDKVKWKCRLPAADAEKYFRMTNKTAIKASLPLQSYAHYLTILGVSNSLWHHPTSRENPPTLTCPPQRLSPCPRSGQCRPAEWTTAYTRP